LLLGFNFLLSSPAATGGVAGLLAPPQAQFGVSCVEVVFGQEAALLTVYELALLRISPSSSLPFKHLDPRCLCLTRHPLPEY